jgi:hypothetical protein
MAVALIAGATAIGSGLGRGDRSITPGGPTPTETRGSKATPSRALPSQPVDVIKDGHRFRAHVAGDTLAFATFGEPGQSITGSFAAAGPVEFVADCLGQAPPNTTVEIRFAGEVKLVGECSEGLPPGDYNPISARAGKAGLGVVWGPVRSPDMAYRKADVSARLVDAATSKPIAAPKARIALGAYLPGMTTPVLDPHMDARSEIPMVLEANGVRYALSTAMTGRLTATGLPSVEVPANSAVLILWGSLMFNGDPPNGTSLFLDGMGRSPSPNAPMGFIPQIPEIRPAGKATRLTMRAVGDFPTGESGAFIAIYVPE